MLIRKLFKFEGSHVVRNCSSTRCKYSRHGHSYKVEVFFTAEGLDNGGMIMDFGLMKGNIKDFIDSFDHAESVWDKDTTAVDQAAQFSERYIVMPITPSAEQYSLMFLYVIDKMTQATEFNNGEKNVRVHSVRVHETDTGFAESYREDLKMVNYTLEDIKFSPHIIKEWTDRHMYQNLLNVKDGEKCYTNDKVDQQV